MKKSNILGITKTYLKEIELTEIDIPLNEEIHKNWYENNKISDRVVIEKNNEEHWEGESIPIKIEDVIKTLKQLNKSGANYVEIMYHGDHYGYIFNGLEIRKSTEIEIKEHLDNNEREKNIVIDLTKIKEQYEIKLKELNKF